MKGEIAAMDITATQLEGQLTLRIDGQVDEPGAERLKQEFRALHSKDIRDLVLDFSGLTHIGSAGLGKLLLFYKSVRTNGGRMKIINASPAIFNLLTELELDKVFSISRK